MPDAGITFIHTADCHLDAPLLGLRLIDPSLADAAARCQRESFVSIIDACIDREADFLIIAGDLFDSGRKNLHTQVVLKKQFERLRERGIRVFIAAGNHDNLEEAGYGRPGAEVTFPDNVHVFSGEAPEEITIEKGGAPAARVVGMSFRRRDVSTNIAELYPAKKGDAFTIGVLHTSVTGASAAAAEHETYAPCTTGDLERKGYDYWALGHIHRRAALDTAMPAVYPGCPQARRGRETGDTSVTLVRVDASGRPEISEIPTGALRMEDVEADISDIGAGAYADLAARIHAEFESLRAGFPPHVKCCVARVRLRGEGPMQRLTLDPYLPEHGKSAVEYTAAALNALEESRSPRIWVREIDASGCRPEKEALDINALRGEDSLAGDVVRLADDLASRPESRAEITCASLLNSLRNSNAANDRLLFRHLERAAADNAAPVAAGDTLGDAITVCLDALRESL